MADHDPVRLGLLAARARGQQAELVEEAVVIASSTIGRCLHRLCHQPIEADHLAPVRVDLLRNAVEDGVLPEAHEPNPGHV